MLNPELGDSDGLLFSNAQYGYGQWEAVKMAVRRSPNFRFDYFLRSLPSELIGRRCEQLMKAAEKEVEQLERKAREDAGLIAEEEKKGESDEDGISQEAESLPPIELPKFKVLRAQRRMAARQEEEAERQQLEEKVFEIEQQMREIQDRMKVLNEYSRETTSQSVLSTEFPDELLPDLVNLVAKSGASGIAFIANTFAADHPGQVSKKKICSKIGDVAVKERREEEGDTKPSWYVRTDFRHLLDVDTLRFLRLAKEEKEHNESEKSRETSDHNRTEETADIGDDANDEPGARGPDGEFIPFPEYDGSEPPKECKKAFTHFCNGTRKEVKKSLDPSMRKNKVSAPPLWTVTIIHVALTPVVIPDHSKR